MIKKLFDTVFEKKTKFKDIVTDKKLFLALLFLIAINLIYYFIFFKYFDESLSELMILDISFTLINLIISSLINKKTFKTMLMFFIVIKILSSLFGMLSHDAGVYLGFGASIEIIRNISYLIVICGLMVSFSYPFLLIIMTIFHYFEFKIHNKLKTQRWNKIWLIIFFVSQLVIMTVFYNYVVYNFIISNAFEWIKKTNNGKTYLIFYENLKPLLVFISMPLLLKINNVFKSDIFIGKGIFFQVASQITILADLSKIINVHSNLYLTWTIIGMVIITWLFIIKGWIKAFKYNFSFKTQTPPVPAFYSSSFKINYIYEKLLIKYYKSNNS